MKGEAKNKEIFKNYSFILLINNLRQNQIAEIKKNALNYGAKAITTLECPPQRDNIKIKADYLLAE